MIGALLCRMGWHDAEPKGRWNGGYCFTRCRRCGRDMVRSAFGEWHIPKGYRVVWGPPGSVADLDEALAAAWPAAPALTAAPPPNTDDGWLADDAWPIGDAPAAAVPAAPVKAAPGARPRPGTGLHGRSPFDFADFDHVEDRAGGADPFPAPPELRRRAPPA